MVLNMDYHTNDQRWKQKEMLGKWVNFNYLYLIYIPHH